MTWTSPAPSRQAERAASVAHVATADHRDALPGHRLGGSGHARVLHRAQADLSRKSVPWDNAGDLFAGDAELAALVGADGRMTALNPPFCNRVSSVKSRPRALLHSMRTPARRDILYLGEGVLRGGGTRGCLRSSYRLGRGASRRR